MPFCRAKYRIATRHCRRLGTVSIIETVRQQDVEVELLSQRRLDDGDVLFICAAAHSDASKHLAIK